MGSPRARHGETARDHLTTLVPTASPDATAGAARAALAGRRFEVADALFLVDADGRLVGRVTLVDLLAAPADQPLAALSSSAPARVGPGADQEHVAHVALDHDGASVPIVDDDGRFLGVVPAQALLHVLRREHVEDLHRLAGIRREDQRARSALEAPPARRARDRLPWLLVGLVGSALATVVMSRFEALLSHRVAVAFFVPAIVYLADAIGTQTETVAVRGLSHSHRPLRTLLVGELRTGGLIGASLGALAFAGVSLATGDARLGVAVGASLLVAGGAATTVGLLLPWMLSRAGRDPAFGSGPLATIVQDVLSILAYLAIASLVLG